MGQENKQQSDSPFIHVYYADDDTDDIEVFEEAVRLLMAGGLNIRLKTYTGGAALLHYLQNESPAAGIIFLDINMPLKNGFEVLDEIRETDALSRLSVVMYSTSSDAGAIEKSRDKGASLYVVKPIDFKDLEAIIKKVVGMAREGFSIQPHEFVIGRKM